MAANRRLLDCFRVRPNGVTDLRITRARLTNLLSSIQLFRSPCLFRLYSAARSFSAASNSRPPRRRGEYLFGVSPCLAALKAGRRKVHSVLLREGTIDGERALKRVKLAELQMIAERRRVDIHWVTKGMMERLSGNRPTQGIAIDVSPLHYKEMDVVDCQLSESKAAQKPVWLALDEIQDPMNLGAILRCALYLGVDRVVAAKKCCPLTPIVSKASSGAMEFMSVYSVRDMAKFLAAAKESGWSILGTCKPAAAKDVYSSARVVNCTEYQVTTPTLLVLGNEGHGIRKAVERECEHMLTIPPVKHLPLGFDSLNVSVATGILLHALQRTRQLAAADELQLHT